MKPKETFHYTYSATKQDEVKKIRDKYIPTEKSKYDQLKKLDASVTHLGTKVSIIIGTISTLVMGFGMSCTMVWKESLFIPGIIIGIIGMIGIALAYPIFNYLTKKQRKKIAPLIIELSNELIGKE